MSGKRSLFPRSLALAALAAAALMLFTVGAVAADTQVRAVGNYGRSRLVDATAKPGATCIYRSGFGNSLERVRVKAPRVWARDRTANVDRQPVGWRFFVEHRQSPSETWVRIYTSATQAAQASDTTPAAFTAMSASPDVINESDHDYRVVVRIVWYGNTGTRQGTVDRLVDHYRWRDESGPIEPADDPSSCRGKVGF